jgi:hypothetical protein
MAGELSLDDCQIADVGEHHEINIFRVLLKPHWEIPPGPGQSPAAHLGENGISYLNGTDGPLNLTVALGAQVRYPGLLHND